MKTKNFISLLGFLVFQGFMLGQNFGWVKQIGALLNDKGINILVDRSGNIYLKGVFGYDFDFDPGPGTHILSANGESDVFILKLDNAGNYIWAVNFGGPDMDYWFEHQSVFDLDSSGNVYLMGIFSGTADFDPGLGVNNMTASSLRSNYVCKINSSGNLIWAKQYEGGDLGWPAFLGIDPSRNILTVGKFSGTTDFNPGPGIDTLNGFDAGFITKLDSGGNFLWAKQIGQVPNCGRFSPSGEALLGGAFIGTVDFDPGTGLNNLTSSGSGINYDLFLLKLNSIGNFEWVKQFNCNGDQDMEAIKVNNNGDILMTSEFSGTIDFDPGPGTSNLTSIGNYDSYICCLDSSGNYKWANAFHGLGSSDEGIGMAIEVDQSSNILVCGEFDGSMDFDPGVGNVTLSGGGVFVTKLDQNGNYLASYQIMGNNNGGEGIVMDGSNNLYVTGYFKGTADFDPGAGVSNLISNSNSEDAFLLKLTNISTDIVHTSTKGEIIIFPNPANSSFTVVDQDHSGKMNDLQLTDATGRVVKVISNVNLVNGLKIDVSELSNGMYSIQIQSDEQFQVMKIVKQ